MKKLCKCGHSHVSYVGDLGEDEDEEGYDRIEECEHCSCERFTVEVAE